MAWLVPLGLVAIAVCVGVLSFAVGWYRKSSRRAHQRERPLDSGSRGFEAVTLKTEGQSEVDDEDARERLARMSAFEAHDGTAWPQAVSVHTAPTLEFAAYSEQLAARTMAPHAAAWALDVHDKPTREIAAHEDEPTMPRAAHEPSSRRGSEGVRLASGLQSRTGENRARREDEATLKVGVARRESRPSQSPLIEDLLRMLGPSPAPDLGNIEIYYRLGLAYLESGQPLQARHCFLTVEEVCPGYRDTTHRLASLTARAPKVSGENLIQRGMSDSGSIPAPREATTAERAPATGRSNVR